MAGGMDTDRLLRIAVDRGASDVHLKVGSHPLLRIDGHLLPLCDEPRLQPDELLGVAQSLMSDFQRQRFGESCEVDTAYEVPGVARFRVSLFQERGRAGIVLRIVPSYIRSLDELHLPRVLQSICDLPRGLILVTGRTGSGKSTTLAAMVDRINSTRAEHIITIEDPIEFLHADKLGYVNQRQVNADTISFAAALRAALRQDPDVILVGEMRDLETISTALHAAETGHTVFSTLHTIDAVETINRIVCMFGPSEQEQARIQLGSVLRAVVSQRLVERLDGGGRVPAAEVMINSAYIHECILAPDKTRSIREAIAAGTSHYGMQTFDQSLWNLLEQGLISLDTAVGNASNADDFRLRMQGIASTSELSQQAMAAASGMR